MHRLRWFMVVALVGFVALAWTFSGLKGTISVAQDVRNPPPGENGDGKIFFPGPVKPGRPNPNPKQPGKPPRNHNYLEKVKAIHAQHHLTFLKKKGMIGIGIMKDPARSGEYAFRVYTTGNPKPDVPAEIDGVPLYERYLVEGFKPFQPPIYQQFLPRPVPIGVSTANENTNLCYRGTLGCRVVRPRDGSRLMLSNNHVWALENDANAGDPVMQPGFFSTVGCISAFPFLRIGRLEHFVPLNYTSVNKFDVSLSSTTEDLVGVSTLPDGYGTPTRFAYPVELGDGVQKYGSTSGYTAGQISAIDVSFIVGYGNGPALFTGQLEALPVPPYSSLGQPGDSGSLVVNDDNHPIGLLFAGIGNITNMNPIAPLLNFYRVRVDDGGFYDTGDTAPPPGKRLKPVRPNPPPIVNP